MWQERKVASKKEVGARELKCEHEGKNGTEGPGKVVTTQTVQSLQAVFKIFVFILKAIAEL